MARRKTQLFNLSFLDLITGALGAVIFLFIITPKGGSSAPDAKQLVMYMDTARMKVFGDLPDSLRSKRAGDTLFTVLVDYRQFPQAEKPGPIPQTAIEAPVRPAPTAAAPSGPRPETASKVAEKPGQASEKPAKVSEHQPESTPVFKGDAPSVPCKVSFEVSWANQSDNVDFFVCKGNVCVYGGNKKHRSIGQWDSGKSRNRLFGNDLRTTQEAVRQFDRIIPGEYLLYAQLKESKSGNKTVRLKGLIYTKGKAGKQRGEHFTKTISIGKSRVLLGKVLLRADGSYQFIQQ